MGNSIPKLLPASTLACPPSSAYIKQFIKNNNTLIFNGAKTQSMARLESTAPIKNDNLNIKNSNLLNTERYNSNKILNASPSAPSIKQTKNIDNID
jgi:hypothetical protein